MAQAIRNLLLSCIGIIQIQNSRTFAETVQGYHVKVEDRKHPTQLCITDKGKTQLGMERMMVSDLEHAKMVLSGLLVAKPCLLAPGGESMKSRSLNKGINLGETIPV